MGHSYVEFRGRSRLMPDIEIVTAVHVVLDVVRETPSLKLTENIDALLESWGTLMEPYGPGCLDVALDKFVETDADRDCLLDLLERSRGKLQEFGATVPGDYLDRVVDAPGVLQFVDRPVGDVLVAFDKMKGVLTEA